MSACQSLVKPGRPSRGEITCVVAGLAGLIALQLLLTDSLYLFTANFWVDELFTYTLVTDPDLPHAMRALAHAVDTNPPGLHLLLRAFTGVLGSQGEAAFRAFALLALFAALVGVYGVLREVFSPLAALAGTLAVWCHPLIGRHAFEARFYGPWLAAVVWFAYFLAQSLHAPGKRWPRLAVALSSILVCTIHYFGIVTLALVIASELWISRPRARACCPSLAAAALGPLALLACTPFFLGQRAALTLGTWIEPLSPAGAVVGCLPVLALFCLYRLRGLVAKRLPAGRDAPAVAGLVGLVLLPTVLTVFSLTIQPATLARYILPSLVILGPATAFLAAGLRRRWQVALCALLAGGSACGLGHLARLYRDRDRRTAELAAYIRSQTGTAPVAFEFQSHLYEVCHYAPDIRARCFLLDFEPDQLGPVSIHRIVTRDVGRQYAAFYHRPGLLPWSRFKDLPARYLVPGGDLGQQPPLASAHYPGYALRYRSAGLFELVPAPDTALATARSGGAGALRTTASRETPRGGRNQGQQAGCTRTWKSS